MDYIEVIMPRIPSEKKSHDSDIDKLYFMCNPNIPEIVNNLANKSYNRIANIASHEAKELNLAIAAQYLHYDVGIIANLIKDNALPNSDKLEQFIKNCCHIYEMIDAEYRSWFNLIKDFHHNSKIVKPIEEMDKDELLDYIKKHKL